MRVALASLLIASACSGSRDRSIADLQSPRPEVRALAVKKLAEHFEAEDVGLFTQAARDPVAFVRAEAMAALGKSQDTRVVDLLGDALADPDERVQRSAAAALAAIKTEKAKGYLTLQYSRRGRSTRMAIVQALKGANIPGAMASVVAAEASALWERNSRALDEGALPERVGAAEELGRSGRPDAVNRLVPLLTDPQVVLAAAAARGLGYARDTRAVPALAALLDENDPELRIAACEALGALADPSPLPRLLAVALERSPASPSAAAAIAALPAGDATSAALCDITFSGNPGTAALAGRVMRGRGGCPVDLALERFKAAATIPAALDGVRVLGAPPGGGSRELVARITPLLAAPDTAVRRLAVEALVQLADEATPQLVLRTLDAELRSLEPSRTDWVKGPLPGEDAPGFEPDHAAERDPLWSVRGRTRDLFRRVQELGAMRAREAGKVLAQARPPVELVPDGAEEDLVVLAALLEALGRLGVEGAVQRVAPFTADPSPAVRAAAWAATARLGQEATSGLFDQDRSVQGATARALVEVGPAGVTTVATALSRMVGDRSLVVDALKGATVPPQAVPPLMTVMLEGASDAGPVALLLAGTGAPEVVEAMVRLLDEPTLVARPAVLTALGQMGASTAADTIARDLYSDSAGVRAAAAEALGRLEARTHLEAIDALKGDYDVRVRTVATGAVERLSGGAR